MDDVTTIRSKYDELRRVNADRDIRMAQVTQIRANNTEAVAPGLFSPEWPKPIIANFIDAAAHDLSEVIAPLPAVNCNASNYVNDADRKRAEKRTRVAAYYMEASRLQQQMYSGADRYLSYGFLPIMIEPNLKEQRPHLQVDNPMGAYPSFDRYGNVVAYAKRFLEPASVLAARFPEYANQITASNTTYNASGLVELVKWYDAEQTCLFMPDRGGLLLAQVRQPLGYCPVAVAQLPSFDEETRGQFDSVLWVQLARGKMAMLKLEAAHKAVEAPIALPQDVQHLALGGDAIVRSSSPEKIRRVELSVPSSIFAEDAALEKEMRTGARYPEARGGSLDASIITGRGVQALMGGFDTQVKTAQVMFAQALQDALGMCFDMDEKLWPSVAKDIKGTENGQAYAIQYTAAKDIRGDHTVSVDYGLMAGLDPNRALVWGLQARSDKLISRQFLRKNLPVSLNATLEEEIIDIEDGRDALKQAIAGYVQAIPLLAQQGQDPGKIVRAMGLYVSSRRKGVSIEDAIAAAFEPEPVPPAAPGGPGAAAQPGVDAAGGQGPDVPMGYDAASGQMSGVADGQAGMPRGGRPDIRSMLAQLGSNGQAKMAVSTQKRQAF